MTQRGQFRMAFDTIRSRDVLGYVPRPAALEIRREILAANKRTRQKRGCLGKHG